MNGRSQVVAVVVTFLPDQAVIGRLDAIRREVDRMVIVDNASPQETRTVLESWAAANDATLLPNAVNLGLAAALNQGLAWGEANDCEWAVTFDQDSTPQRGLVNALRAAVQAAASPEKVGIVGSHTFDERSGRQDLWLQPAWYGFRRVPCGNEDLEVTFVISSGALTRLRTWREMGGLDDGLFIDYIDHDLCLKAARLGWLTRVSAEARLAHNLGSKREVAVAGRRMRPTFHTPTRHYYMARNRVAMWRRHALHFPHWWLFDLGFGALNAVRVSLAEDRSAEKLIAMLRGTWDGLRGKKGVMPK